MEPAITDTFNRSLQDFPYYNLPVYSGHLYITAIFDQSLGWPLLAGSTVYIRDVVVVVVVVVVYSYVS